MAPGLVGHFDVVAADLREIAPLPRDSLGGLNRPAGFAARLEPRERRRHDGAVPPSPTPEFDARAASIRMEEALRLGREVIRLRAQVLGVSYREAERIMEIEKQQGRNPSRCATPR